MNDGTARVEITTGVFTPSRMQYFYKPDRKWVDVANPSFKGPTISGDIPVAHLKWTPIVIGTA